MKRFGIAFSLGFLILLLIPLVNANASNSTAQYDFFIHDNEVTVNVLYSFGQSRLIELRLNLPKDAMNINLKIDGVESKPTIINLGNYKVISIYRIAKTIQLSYDSKSLLKRNIFITDLESPFSFSNFTIKLKLAPNYILESPVKKGTFSTASIYPEPTALETDGQTISFVWAYNDTPKGKSYPIIVLLKQRTNKFVLYTVILLLILTPVSIFFFVKKKPKVEKIIIRKVDKISKHLKEDEEQVLNILKQKGGKCEQGTLRVVTGMSKAKLSQLLKELEERKLITKRKQGKKNIIIRL